MGGGDVQEARPRAPSTLREGKSALAGLRFLVGGGERGRTRVVAAAGLEVRPEELSFHGGLSPQLARPAVTVPRPALPAALESSQEIQDARGHGYGP